MATKTRTKDLKESGIEWIGKIPQDWIVEKLKYTSKLRNEKLEQADGLDYIGLENIESGTGKAVASKEIMEPESIINHFHPGDVLFGKLRPYLAKVLPVMKEGVCTSELLVLQPKEVTQRFLSYRLIASDFISLVDNSTYGAKMPRASWNFIGNIPIAHPPKDEQKKVTNFLDTKTSAIDDSIEQKRKLIDLLKEKRTAIINHAMTRGLDKNVELVDSGVEWIGKVPKRWRAYKLKFFCEFQSGDGFPDELQGQETKEIPFFKVSDINGEEKFVVDSNNYVTKEAVQRKGWHMIAAGSILMAKIGAALAKNHRKVAQVDCCIDNNMLAVTARPKIIEPEYLYWIWKNIDIADFQNISSVPSVNMGMLKEHQYPIPPKSEQIAIAKELNTVTATIDGTIRRIEKSIDLLNEYRTSLISHVVTGKVDVN